MATSVTLKIKEQQGEETITKKVQHEIEDITGWQFAKLLKVVTSILTELQKDESLKDLMDDFFSGGQDIDLENIEDMGNLSEKLDGEFLQKMVGAFPFLLERLPEQAFSLLSILSGIEKETLKSQKLFDLMDIFDAVIAENDIERLFNRVKKSLGTMVSKMKWLKKVKEATQA